MTLLLTHLINCINEKVSIINTTTLDNKFTITLSYPSITLLLPDLIILQFGE